MSVAERTTEQRLTIGEVCRALQASGCGRSATVLRRLERAGVVTPMRTPGLGLRLYSLGDVEALKVAIRDREGSRDAA